ncbi:MAG TPA: hypothetical protein VNT56_05240 [Acidimicrobiales bacterium]|nr:hypothetical protein [Acidimicrobiales bacterium]
MPAPSPVPGGSPGRRRALRLAELLTLSDQTDEDGRLLLEDSASRQAQKRARRAGVAMTDARCDYPDSPSRQGGRMNVSAYEAVRRDVAAVLDGFAWLAELRAGAAPEPGRSSLAALADVANLGSTLPLVLFHRSEEPVPAQGALPAFVASVFKASRGLFSGAVAMANDAEDPAAAVSTGEVMAYAEGHGQLRRVETGRVCAAPTRLIARTVEAILTGEGADPGRSRLGDHVEADQLWAYFSLHDALSQSLSTYRYVLEDLTRAHPGASVEQLAGAGVAVGGRSGSFGDLTDAVVHTATLTQSRMNEVLGRAADAPPLTVAALLRIL